MRASTSGDRIKYTAASGTLAPRRTTMREAHVADVEVARRSDVQHPLLDHFRVKTPESRFLKLNSRHRAFGIPRAKCGVTSGSVPNDHLF